MASRSKRAQERLALLADVKLGYKPEEAAFVLGSSQLLAEMVAAKWVTPVVHRHKLVLFDRGDLSKAWARVLNGEQPPRLVRAPIKQSRKDAGANDATATTSSGTIPGNAQETVRRPVNRCASPHKNKTPIAK